jgi:hypothetical protein
MRVFHGTDQELNCLLEGSFVTKNIRDAWKFGFRRAYESGSQTVYVYTLEIDRADMKPDPRRHRAFILKHFVNTNLVEEKWKFEVPYSMRLYP